MECIENPTRVNESFVIAVAAGIKTMRPFAAFSQNSLFLSGSFEMNDLFVRAVLLPENRKND
ncbi:hypothetical protein DPPLL_19670 [Desulfofustis limnaeus]|uniref:Uncharacterized protein n=1 Tax=Desulfofustis limnaeus TaxID=2740163 RepID=A0ABM7W9E8_9BACT|nr:hypothetical protein DPPLL_19670 [Desulfofustis limnaeus]